MTILELLNRMNSGNKLMEKSLEVIKDNFINLVNDNYELVFNENGELKVKIPSLEKRNEYEYKNLSEYKYPLIMCMKIQELKNVEAYNFLLSLFMDAYKDKLDLLFKDINTTYKLKANIISTKNNIDYITYASLVTGIIGAISLCVFDLNNITKVIFITGTIIFFITPILMQAMKESKVKKVIDAYLGLIKTDWYKEDLLKQYTFLCNFVEESI